MKIQKEKGDTPEKIKPKDEDQKKFQTQKSHTQYPGA